MSYYYEHPHENTLHTDILSATQTKTGWLIELKETLFYPEGGGQPADKGLLDDQSVLDVQKIDGHILHTVQEKPKNTSVLLTLDRAHRDFYRIRHTAQHLLSAILYKRYDINTVSIHLNYDAIDIEIDRTEMSDEDISKVETEAASIIAENRTVRAFWVKNQQELKTYNIRSSSSMKENIRIIEIEGFDRSPCGGLHADNTAQLALIKYAGKEKVRGHLRLKWHIASTAFAEYTMLQKEMKKISNLLSVPAEQAVERVAAVLEEKDAALLALKKAEEKTAAALCSTLYNETALIVQHLDDCTPSLFKEVCRKLSEKEPCVFLLTCASEKGVQWVLHIPDTKDFDFSRFNAECLVHIKGKGGGRPPRWQGVGTDTTELEKFFTSFKAMLHTIETF